PRRPCLSGAFAAIAGARLNPHCDLPRDPRIRMPSELDEARPLANDRRVLEGLPPMTLESTEEVATAPRDEGEVRGQRSVAGDEEEEVTIQPPAETDAVPGSLSDDRPTPEPTESKLLAADQQPVDRRRVDQRQAHRDPPDAFTTSANHLDHRARPVEPSTTAIRMVRASLEISADTTPPTQLGCRLGSTVPKLDH